MTNIDLIAIANKEIARRNKISATKTGGKHTEETRQKMREAHARRKALKQKFVGVDAVVGGGE